MIKAGYFLVVDRYPSNNSQYYCTFSNIYSKLVKNMSRFGT